MVISLSSSEPTACCPYYGIWTRGISSRFWRHRADLSCFGHNVRLRLLVHRFFYDKRNCAYGIVAKQFPARTYVRQSSRQAKVPAFLSGLLGSA